MALKLEWRLNYSKYGMLHTHKNFVAGCQILAPTLRKCLLGKTQENYHTVFALETPLGSGQIPLIWLLTIIHRLSYLQCNWP